MAAPVFSPQPKMRVIAGPNGSGKSTLLNYLASNFSFPLGYCLNPDDLERELRDHGRLYIGGWAVGFSAREFAAFHGRHALGGRLPTNSLRVEENAIVVDRKRVRDYFIAIFCDFLRRRWLASFESFTFETVMSHPAKVDGVRRAAAAGYRTYLYYVCTESPTINRARVKNRVALGGHAVTNKRIDERYRRSLAMLPQTIRIVSRAFLFDNSKQEHALIAEFDAGKLARIGRVVPNWFVNSVLTPLGLSAAR